MSARFNTPDVSCSCEFSGVVTRTGSDVRHLAVGDRVVAMAPGRYRTYETVPEWACVKLQSDEEFEVSDSRGKHLIKTDVRLTWSATAI